jgi:hypothetical protein
VFFDAMTQQAARKKTLRTDNISVSKPITLRVDRILWVCIAQFIKMWNIKYNVCMKEEQFPGRFGES